ncbi:MAG: 30S ribosomal protein S18 [Candidatus Pacebacteria bacterium]|nr:30S ribosomal protein S18 [Candidatus Paceibacterota bacterium]NUQ57753.1 30S ribosomal protein S18 [Candidatus Paceibacter sp.]
MKQCYFCTNNINSVDYKKTETLKKFLTHHARIAAKSDTGVCAKHQRKLATAIKRARVMGLLPFVSA